MKIIGIVSNLIGLIGTMVLIATYLADRPSVSLIGGDNGPTTIFITAKINYFGLIVILFFFLTFAFNVYSFLRLKTKNKR